jgi:hypothetical protein
MAFVDWVINKSIATETVALGVPNEDFAPILGTGSLHVFLRSSASTVNLYNLAYTRGNPTGKIRTIITPLTITGVFSYSVGFYFNADQDDVTVSGNTYSALFVSDSFNLVSLELRKHSTSGISGAGTLLLTVPLGIVTLPTAFEVEWKANIPSIGDLEVVFRAEIGTFDFENLSDVGSIVDSTAPFLSSVSEGIAAKNGSSGSMQYLLDSTEIFSSL